MASFEGKRLVNSGQGACVHHPPCRGPEAHGRLRLQQAHQGCCLCRAGCCWGLSTPGPLLFGRCSNRRSRASPPAPPSRPQSLTSGGSLPAVREPRTSSTSPLRGWLPPQAGAAPALRPRSRCAGSGRRVLRLSRCASGRGRRRKESARPAGPLSGILAAPRRSGMLSCARLRLVPKRGRGGFASPSAASTSPETRGLAGKPRPEGDGAVCFWSIASLPSRGRVPAAPPRSVPLSFRSESTAVMQAARLGSARLGSRFPQSAAAAAAAGPISRAALP